MASVGLSGVLRAREASAAVTGAKEKTSAILIWLDGGPGHMDMYDMKPDAPATVRSPYRPISSSAPGIEVCELLPEMAQRMHHVSLIRTMTGLG